MDALDRKYVLAVVREHSFSRAAEKLYISQPALSAYIIKLEKALGTSLFDRSCSPIALTAAGEAYAACARRMEEMEAELENHLSDLNNLNAGQLTVGGSNFYCAYFLPPILAAFAQRYPGVRLELVDDNFPGLLRLLAQGALDCVVDYLPEETADFAVTQLKEERILLAVPWQCAENEALRDCLLLPGDVAAGRHLREDCPRVPLSRFAGEEFVFLNSEHSLHTIGLQLCHSAGFRPKVKMYLNQILTSYALTLAGYGVSFISDTVIQYGNFARSPALYAIDDVLACRRSHLIRKRNRYVSKALREFMRILEETLHIVP